MSKAAINEMLRASFAQFERMVKDIPISDRKVVLKSLESRVALLEGV